MTRSSRTLYLPSVIMGLVLIALPMDIHLTRRLINYLFRQFHVVPKVKVWKLAAMTSKGYQVLSHVGKSFHCTIISVDPSWQLWTLLKKIRELVTGLIETNAFFELGSIGNWVCLSSS